jgi:hypothetical protein
VKTIHRSALFAALWALSPSFFFITLVGELTYWLILVGAVIFIFKSPQINEVLTLAVCLGTIRKIVRTIRVRIVLRKGEKTTLNN